nr:hypothetical protein [Candidatus Njordarchaeota archaeon]
MTECKYTRKWNGERPECTHSSMVLYVGLYCDPAKCEKVRKGEITAIKSQMALEGFWCP